MLDYILFGLGLVGVLLGAQWLVTGSGRLAATFNVPPVVIGLTVVGFGTSAPEIVVSGLASYNGQPGIALGNVIGSNIANIGLVLGFTALLAPLRPELTVLRREGPLMIGISIVVVGFAATGSFTWWMGAGMLVGLAAYIVGSFFVVRGEPEAITEAIAEYETSTGLIGVPGPVAHTGLVVLGLAALIVAAHFLVESAEAIALDLNVPEFVVASTILAIGTSVPELATGVVAARRGQADIAVGNIIGSNVFNLLGVLGLAAFIGEIPVSGARFVDTVIMLAIAVIGVYFARTGHVLNRREGSILLASYFAFTIFLFAQ